MNKRKPKEKEFTFGTCRFERTSPQREAFSASTRAINIYIPFDDALKLNIAVDEACRRLNKYSKSTSEGKRAALNLTIYLDVQKIAVNEGKLKMV
jgi:hypothetical protein